MGELITLNLSARATKCRDCVHFDDVMIESPCDEDYDPSDTTNDVSKCAHSAGVIGGYSPWVNQHGNCIFHPSKFETRPDTDTTPTRNPAERGD